MNDPPGNRLEELFHGALDLPLEQRRPFLECLAGDDALLRADLERLLAGDEQAADHFLQSQDKLQQPEPPDQETIGIPERIGRYKIIRKVGEGGMGVVYEAQQEQPRRHVALKLIRPSLVPGQARKRFEREAEVLGQLEHAGIARIYEFDVADVATARGVMPQQPFYAMELIRGAPIDQFVRERRLTLRDTLELFAQVCEAVNYAHQKGVIHRDLKPSNILADESGKPKILDFGVARITNSDVQATIQTDAGQIIGTLSYMSPEQIAAKPEELDGRSDVYSLGVLLYELVAGKLPYDLRGRTIPEAARVIREEDPSRLSSLDSRFRGDVETIVAKALEKDRARRYTSAAELAADIRRHLRDEPIRARSASAFYQLRKFAKRHKALVGGTLTTIVALALGLAAALREASAARRQAYRATITAATAALQNADVTTAKQSLNMAPESLRGWEWKYLWARLDESLSTIHTDSPLRIFCVSSDSATLALLPESGSASDFPRWALPTGAKLADAPWPPCGFLCEHASYAATVTHLDYGDSALVVHDCATGTERRYFPRDWGLTKPGALNGEMSADAAHYAVVDDHAEVHFVELATGASQKLSMGNLRKRAIFDMSVSRDNRLALPMAVDGKPRVWTPATGELIRLDTDADAIVTMFNKDGSRVAGSTMDGAIRLWDSRTGALLAVGRGHTDWALGLSFSPDGRTIASLSQDRTLRLWDAETLAPVEVFHGHETATRWRPLFTPDGARLVTSSLDGSRYTWDATLRGDPYELRGHTSYVYPVAFSPDGSIIASGSWDNTVRLWDARTGETLAELIGHTAFVTSLAFRGDSLRLTSRGSDKTVHLWDVSTYSKVAVLNDGGDFYAPASFHSDGVHVLLSVDADRRSAKFWDTNTGRAVEAPMSWLSGVSDEAVSSDGRHWASSAKPVAIHDIATGALRGRTDWGPALAAKRVFSPRSAGQPRLAIVQGDFDRRVVAICDAARGNTLAVLRGHTDEVFAAAWLPDGTRLATAGRDQTIRLWDTRSYEQVAELRGHKSYVWSLAWSPDGTRLISGSGDHTVRIWDIQSYRDRLRMRRKGV